MPNFKWVLPLLLFNLSILIPKSEQQLTSQQLKVVASGKRPSQVNPPQFVVSDAAATLPTTSDATRINAGGRFINAASVCVSGMWALYNTTNYGEGQESTTSVISIKSTDINTCTPSNSVAGLTKVQSVNFLGNPNPMMDGVDIYAEPTFLGGAWRITDFTATPVTPTPTGGGGGGSAPTNAISGVRLGSLAITGTSTSAFRLCADTALTNCVCIDMSLQTAGLYIVRNTLTDTTAIWPRVIRAVQRTTSAMCLQDQNPTIPNVRYFLRNEVSRNMTSDIDISIASLMEC